MNNLYKVCANTLWLRGDETLTKDNFANIIAIQNELIATLQEKNRKLEDELNKVYRVTIPELNEYVTDLQDEIKVLKADLRFGKLTK